MKTVKKSFLKAVSDKYKAAKNKKKHLKQSDTKADAARGLGEGAGRNRPCPSWTCIHWQGSQVHQRHSQFIVAEPAGQGAQLQP